ncbi:MAG TPA: alpha/beta fold hydrolase [Solirubrobacteraceae bacterium]|jgi:pimeloyl-ACP methyl ester carboxylesterase
MRAVQVEPPAELGTRDGLAYALFLPDGESAGGVVMVHGAGSQKENQFDVARALRAVGVASVCYDQRGHGESEGALGAGALDDVATIAELLPPGRVALRGSSMGGFIALMASTRMDVAAVVAICPATSALLERGLREGRFSFRADHDGLTALLESSDEAAAAAALGERLLILHAEGDEQVPVASSRELHAAAPGSRLVAVPGGHHQSIQHDGEMVALVVRFLTRALRPHAAPE